MLRVFGGTVAVLAARSSHSTRILKSFKPKKEVSRRRARRKSSAKLSTASRIERTEAQDEDEQHYDEDFDEDEYDDDDDDDDFTLIAETQPSSQHKAPVKREVTQGEREGAMEDEGEDVLEGEASVAFQRKRLVEEALKRMRRANQESPVHIDGEFWPDRPVDIELEFPSVSNEVMQELFDEGKIDSLDPIKAAKYLARQRERLKKEKILLDKLKTVPERVRRAVPVDELPIEEKVQPLQALPETFADVGVTNTALLRSVYTKWSIVKPTEPQALAIPHVLAGRNVFIAAQTGTGKTLAYLLPVLQLLREKELAAKKDGGVFRRRGQRTRALILVPTRELVEQTRTVVQACFDNEEFKHYKVFGMAGGISHDKSEHAGFNNGVDVLISTPDRVLHHLQAKHLTLDDTSFVVIDEADTMFSFEAIEKSLNALLKAMDKAQEDSLTPFQYQFIWVSATVSKSVAQHIAKEWPDAVQAFASNLHKSVDRLRQDFLFGAKGRFKERLLRDTLRKYKDVRTMIFCNSGERVKYVYNFLRKLKIKATYVTSDLLPKKRHANFAEFAEGHVDILVTTDFASRGIDTKARVDHVILYDFPSNVIDYLHRIGRTARANNEGRVTAFVGAEDQALVQRIRDSYERGRSLANIRAVPSFRQIKEKIKEERKKAARAHRTEKIDPKYLTPDGKLKPIEEVDEL